MKLAVASREPSNRTCGADWLQVSKDEMKHVAMLGITTVGWPSAIAALSWIEEELTKAE